MEKTFTQGNIHWQAANALVQAAVQRAEEIGVTINVAVVDSGGHLAAFLRMPGAAFHSIDIAVDKAYTAMSFGLATSQWGQVLDSVSGDCRQSLLGQPRFAGCGGGVPIVLDGERVGGIGVSGGSEQQDQEIAEAAIAALG